MRPFYCRIGSKSRIATKVIQKLPPHDIYVELFFGGGAVFWKKPPSRKEVINDLDQKLIADVGLIKRAPSDLTKYKKNLNTIPRLTGFLKSKTRGDADAITKRLITRCNGFSGNEVVNHRVMQATNPYNKLKNINLYKNRLKNVKIHSSDWVSIVKKYDSPSTVFYLDPPYEKSKGLYQHHAIDYVAMARILKSIRGKFLLSMNDSREVRRVFKDFKISGFKVSGGNGSIGATTRKEVFIYNY